MYDSNLYNKFVTTNLYNKFVQQICTCTTLQLSYVVLFLMVSANGFMYNITKLCFVQHTNDFVMFQFVKSRAKTFAPNFETWEGMPRDDGSICRFDLSIETKSFRSLTNNF